MDGSLIDVIARLAALGLGLSAGALLTEAAVLVPFWRSLEPQEFLRWYAGNASLLLRFFGPLEALPAVVVLLAAGASFYAGAPGGATLAVASLLAVGVLLTFPLYFKTANESFASGTIETDKLGAELRRWSAWHWSRTVAAVAAFSAALLAL